MMNSLYSRPADYTQSSLDEAKIRLWRFYRSIDGLIDPPEDIPDTADATHAYEEFVKVMNDDFNTSVALGLIGDVCGKINKLKDDNRTEAEILARTVRKMGGILGILQDPDFLKSDRSDDEWMEIERLKSDRDIARTQKDWAKADSIRQQLINMGLEVEDTPQGTRTTRVARK